MSILSAGSQDTQDTCDLCPNSADSLKYIGSFDSYIIAYPQAFVNTKMQNKKALLKNNRAETSILSVEAAASAENTYVRYRRQTAIYHKPYIYNALNGVRHAYF